jgi:hypothetical protein
VGFNPTAKLMNGAEIYEANRDEAGAWVVNVRTGIGRFIPMPKEGGSEKVSDVKDAAVACGTTNGVEFTLNSVMTGVANVIAAWSLNGSFNLRNHGGNFNVSRKILIRFSGKLG